MTTQHPDSGRRPCRRSGDVAAFVLGSLPADEAAELRRHLDACPDCAATAAELTRTARSLADADPQHPPRDLVQGVMNRLPADAWAAERRQPVVLLPALLRLAALLLAALGLSLLLRHAPSREAAAPAAGHASQGAAGLALDWLRRAQHEDGSWSAGPTGIRKRYEMGLTGMALMAFMESDPAALRGPRASRIRRGLDFLAASQAADGLIGTRFSGALYNQGLATIALLKACELSPERSWKAAAERALDYICRAQEESGGWGYLGAPPGKPNTSASFWPLQALIRADALGYPDLRPHIRKGLAWMENTVNDQGKMGYTRPDDFPYGSETLTAAGVVCFLTRQEEPEHDKVALMMPSVHEAASAADPVDFYRAYFVATALDLADDQRSDELLASLQRRLAALQAREGGDAGSWDAADRWGSVGGRVYATAMAAMALACN